MSSSFTAVECRDSDGDDEDPDEPSIPLRAVDGIWNPSSVCYLFIHPSIMSLCMLTQPTDDDILYSIIL